MFQVSETDFYNNRKLRESETYKDATKRNASYFDHSYQYSCLVYCKLNTVWLKVEVILFHLPAGW